MSAVIQPRDPPWLAHARLALGVTEIPGKDTAPQMRRWLLAARAWWTDDEQPWCGTFVAGMLKEAGLDPPQHAYRAKAYLEPAWGLSLTSACLGSILVYERKGGGHVTFAVARDRFGYMLGLGGNQREPGARHTGAVTISRFSPQRFIAAIWPRQAVGVTQFPLELADAAGSGVSTVEA